MIIAAKGAAATSAAVLEYRWITAGQGGELYTSDSTTASSWTSRTSSFSTTDINWAVSDGASKYVAVGNAGKLATSSDGITWTQQTSSFSSTPIYGVGYGNGLWVAVGDTGKLATSTDGVTWTQRTSSFGTSTIYCVNYYNGTWVAGGEAKLATSTDGITWTQRTPNIAESIKFVRYVKGPNLWVAGRDTDVAANSLSTATDPTSTWTARTSAYVMWNNNSSEAAAVSDVVSNGTTAVISITKNASGITQRESVQYSTNGTSWTEVEISATNGTKSSSVFIDNAATKLFVHMDYDGSHVYTSTNGTTWTQRTGPGGNNKFFITHSSGAPENRA